MAIVDTSNLTSPAYTKSVPPYELLDSFLPPFYSYSDKTFQDKTYHKLQFGACFNHGDTFGRDELVASMNSPYLTMGAAGQSDGTVLFTNQIKRFEEEISLTSLPASVPDMTIRRIGRECYTRFFGPSWQEGTKYNTDYGRKPNWMTITTYHSGSVTNSDTENNYIQLPTIGNNGSVRIACAYSNPSNFIPQSYISGKLNDAWNLFTTSQDVNMQRFFFKANWRPIIYWPEYPNTTGVIGVSQITLPIFPFIDINQQSPVTLPSPVWQGTTVTEACTYHFYYRNNHFTEFREDFIRAIESGNQRIY